MALLARTRTTPEPVYCGCGHKHADHDGNGGECQNAACGCGRFTEAGLYPVMDRLFDELHYRYRRCGCMDCIAAPLQGGRGRIGGVEGAYELTLVVPVDKDKYRRASYSDGEGWNGAARKLLDQEEYFKHGRSIAETDNPYYEESC